MILDLAECDVEQRAVWIERERVLQAGLSALDVARLLFRQRQLQQPCDVRRMVTEERAKLTRRVVVLPK